MGLLDRLRHDALGWFNLEVGSLQLRVGTRIGDAGDLRDEARIVAMRHWEQLEAYVAANSTFQTSFVPLPVSNGRRWWSGR